ncbi:hypothetical protein Acsp02_09130 [Actinoplanes sp. NBRC 103695]|nr:hypothetical protein Acsp02_09130 [Actinoplanes sp. NBRC 103695]
MVSPGDFPRGRPALKPPALCLHKAQTRAFRMFTLGAKPPDPCWGLAPDPELLPGLSTDPGPCRGCPQTPTPAGAAHRPLPLPGLPPSLLGPSLRVLGGAGCEPGLWLVGG